MEFLNQPHQNEKGEIQDLNAIPLFNPEAKSQSLLFNEIWEELETVLGQLRFFEENCVWWNADGHTGVDEQAFLHITINLMEQIIDVGRNATQGPIKQSSGRPEVKNVTSWGTKPLQLPASFKRLD